MEEEFSAIKGSRASPDLFDDLQVKAYGEMQDFIDVAQTIVRGDQLLIIKVYDESVKDEVVKSLNRCDMDIEISMEGKDIRVKLGIAKKEHIDKSLKIVKSISDQCKKDLRGQRSAI